MLKASAGRSGAPWTSWAILACIETDAGNLAAAVDAKRRAISDYLAYRRDGGGNDHVLAQISLIVRNYLLKTEPESATLLLQHLDTITDAHPIRPFFRSLKSIVAGSRDPALADASDLSYVMAAEILFVIQALSPAG